MEALSSPLESVQRCIAALQGTKEDESQGEEASTAKERVGRLVRSWNILRSSLTSLLSERAAEDVLLRKSLEKAEYEKTSSENLVEGLREEIEERTRSLLQAKREEGAEGKREEGGARWGGKDSATPEVCSRDQMDTSVKKPDFPSQVLESDNGNGEIETLESDQATSLTTPTTSCTPLQSGG